MSPIVLVFLSLYAVSGSCIALAYFLACAGEKMAERSLASLRESGEAAIASERPAASRTLRFQKK